MKSILFLHRSRNLIYSFSDFMSRKSSQTRSTHTGKTNLKEITNKLTKLQLNRTNTVRRYSAKNFSLENLVESIKSRQYKRIVVLAGAGISTPSGIPDFRTPGTGLYDNLQRYNIPYPEAIFELNYFHRNPKPFFHLAKELYPGRYLPNLIHYFIRYLHDENLLHRVYTQNIDGLERLAGIPAEKIVEAHGTFLTATCLRCRQKYECEEIRSLIFEDEIPKCSKTSRCSGVIKPDIVFFGEDLPRRFQLYLQDLPMSDCCIVMGTSLAVYPFADIVDSTSRSAARLLINRQLVGTFLSPRSFDLTMIGDLELNVKDLLKKLDVLDRVMVLMKEENFRLETTKKISIRQTSAKSNDRLKAAETFLQGQRRKFSTYASNRSETSTVISQPRSFFNESTKYIVEQHNNALLLQRRRSKSALPVLPMKITPIRRASSSSSSSSPSSSADSLNSSLSDRELSPFAFKRSDGKKSQSFRHVKPLTKSKINGNPLLNATLRTAF